MKKLIIACVIFILLIMSGYQKAEFTLLDFFEGDYTVYSREGVHGAINLGFCYMSNDRADKSVVGESVSIKNFEPISALEALNATLINTEVLEDGTIVLYAYTKMITNCVVKDNANVNLQIACKDDGCVIGWPLILGSF